MEIEIGLVVDENKAGREKQDHWEGILHNESDNSETDKDEAK